MNRKSTMNRKMREEELHEDLRSGFLRSVLRGKLRGLWGRIRAGLAKYRKRLGDIPKIRSEGFEALLFLEMVGAWTFFGTAWFIGTVADFWRSILPPWSWAVALGGILFLITLGFFEQDYRARRLGALLAFFLLFCAGVWTTRHYPRFPFGFILVGGSVLPFWLHSEFKAMKIRAASRQGTRSPLLPGTAEAQESSVMVTREAEERAAIEIALRAARRA